MVELHREGSAPAACTAGLFLQYEIPVDNSCWWSIVESGSEGEFLLNILRLITVSEGKGEMGTVHWLQREDYECLNLN